MSLADVAAQLLAAGAASRPQQPQRGAPVAYDPATHRWCAYGAHLLPLAAFNKGRRGRPQNYCAACMVAYQAAYYARRKAARAARKKP